MNILHTKRSLVPNVILQHRCDVQFKKRENNHGGVLLVVKCQTLACKVIKGNTPQWVFFTFFKLYKWYQIAQSISYDTNIEFKRVNCF